MTPRFRSANDDPSRSPNDDLADRIPLPKGSNVQRRTSHDRRGPISRGQGRRSIMILETLEGRTVLSNVSVLFANNVLTITGDTHNDSFSITETAGGKVTVASTSPQTTIDLTREPYTSPTKVTSISVTLPGTYNFDNVALKGPGKTATTTVNTVAVTATGANLTFAANGVDNSGSFTLSDTVGLPGEHDACHSMPQLTTTHSHQSRSPRPATSRPKSS